MVKSKDRRYIIISSLFIAVVGFMIYANSLDGKFLWDDYYLVEHNVYIRDISFLPKIFTESIFAGAGRRSHFYRPIQTLTYMLDYSLWRLDERGYHITNTILHILSALCILWFIYLLFDDWLISAFAGILFVAHPVHTEAVSYISGRADSLSLIFLLLAFIFYVRYVQQARVKFIISAGISFAASLLSKEAALIFPVLILLYHYTFRKRVEAKAFLPVAVIALFYVIIRYTALSGLGYKVIKQAGILQRLPGFFVAMAEYVRLLIFPLGLHMEYGDRLFAITEPRAIAGIAVLVFLIYYALKKRQARGLIFWSKNLKSGTTENRRSDLPPNAIFLFAVGWFITALLPYSNIHPINAYMAEHWLYLPSIGFFLAVAGALSYLCRRQGLKALGITAAVLVVLYSSYLTIKQNRYWKEPIAFYENTLKFFPGNARIYNNLAIFYFKAGRVQEAIELYEEAIRIRPDYPETYLNLGNIYSNTERAQKAVELYKKAISIDPVNSRAYNNLGIAYSRLGNNKEAALNYERAIEIDPNYPEAYNNLAVIYDDMGKREEAVGLYIKSIRLNPNQAGTYNNLGNAYFKLGRMQEAVEAYNKSIMLRPDNPNIYNNIAAAYHSMGQGEEAAGALNKALELKAKK